MTELLATLEIAIVDPVAPSPEVWRRLRRSVEQVAAHDRVRARPRRPD
jgi:hypothetical protein